MGERQCKVGAEAVNLPGLRSRSRSRKVGKKERGCDARELSRYLIEEIQETTLPAYPSPSLLRHIPEAMSKPLGKRYEVGMVPCKTERKHIRAAAVPPGMDSVGSAIVLMS